MNNAQRAALLVAGVRWYGLWIGDGWMTKMDGDLIWGPRSVMLALAADLNKYNDRGVIAKAFPDPELDEAEAHQQEPEPPPAPDTSFKW